MMNFFNEEWMQRESGHELAWKEYSEYVLDDEKGSFPESCRSFVRKLVNIHDYKIVKATQEDCLSLLLKGSNNEIELRYEGVFLSRKNKIVLDRVANDHRYSIGYDEFREDDSDFFHHLSFFVEDGLDGELVIMFDSFAFDILS